MPPESYSVMLDGETLIDETNDLACSISTEGLTPGEHTVSVKANGVTNRYPLSWVEYDEVSEEPMPVVVEKIVQVN